MGRNRKMSKLFLIFLASSLVLWYIDNIVLPYHHFSVYISWIALSFYVLTLTFLIPFVAEQLLPESGSMMSDEKKVTSEATEKSSEKIQKTEVDKTAVSTRRSEGFFSRMNFFSQEKKCDECGTELEYREDYQSYYCSVCHTYKRE